MKRVLVTGGAGFLGSRVCALLAGIYDVTAPRSAEYDLVKYGDVMRLYDDAKPDIVIHLAAKVGGIGANQANPAGFLYDNLMMGTQMMHAAHLAGVQKLVTAGTVCAYPKHTPVPFREDDLWNGYPEETNAPYGLAKRLLLVQGQAYRKQYGLNAIYLLPVNLYGPGDNFDLQTSHVIPAMIRKFVSAAQEGLSEVVLWGTGSASREFLHVEDAALAIVLAMEKYDGGAPVNIGSGREITIRDLAELVASLTGFKGRIVWNSSKPNGQPRRCLDVTRAEKEFGFKSAITLEAGLRETVEWYLDKSAK